MSFFSGKVGAEFGNLYKNHHSVSSNFDHGSSAQASSHWGDFFLLLPRQAGGMSFFPLALYSRLLSMQGDGPTRSDTHHRG